VLGFMSHGVFENAGWYVNAKAFAANPAGLFLAYATLAAKVAVAAALNMGVARFVLAPFLSRVDAAAGVHRIGALKFSSVLAAAFLTGMFWPVWTSHSGVAGAAFFSVVAAVAFCILEIPIRGFWQRVGFMAAVLALFLLVANLAATFAGLWVPSVLGLLLVTVPISLVAWMGPYENQHSKLGSFVMILIALFVFVGGTIWVLMFSFTNIRILPLFTPQEWWDSFNGLANYNRLFNTTRWFDCPAITKIGTEAWNLSCRGSLANVITYAVFFITIVMSLGFLIAVMMDQKIRAEGLFRTIYLYPFALSFIVTGHVWAWILSPEYGLQKAVRSWGWESFSFGWIADRDMVMYAIVLAGVWQGTGFVMALMLAGLRGIDEEVWKAARIDGIPTWRTYVQIVLPMMKPVLVTTFVFVASGAIRIYDLVIATTDGGPGVSSDVPSRYIYQNFSANLGQSLAASTVMLVLMAIVLIPWIRMEFGKKA
jgi:glucose/mannose transport system permease protein